MKQKISITVEEDAREFLKIQGNGNMSAGFDKTLDQRVDALHFLEEVDNIIYTFTDGSDTVDYEKMTHFIIKELEKAKSRIF